MELERIDYALWLWVVLSIAAGVTLIIVGLGTLLAFVGVILIIIGLVSMLLAMQTTIDEFPFDLAK